MPFYIKANIQLKKIISFKEHFHKRGVCLLKYQLTLILMRKSRSHKTYMLPNYFHRF